MKKILDFRAKKDAIKIYVYFNDWCPACIEYKVTLNMVMTKQNFEIDYSMPDNICVTSIPTTIFVKNKCFYRLEGFVTYDRFMEAYNEVVNS